MSTAPGDHSESKESFKLGLTDVPETMLWTLHNRWSAARRKDISWFNDPKVIEIHDAIDYDFEKTFGKGENSHAIRATVFDEAIKTFWKDSPNGTVVNFAEGLETQRYRLQEYMSDDALWISIDLPDGMKAREKFIQPDEKHLHVDVSVLNVGAWMPVVPKDKPVFFTAQGLFMYLEEEENKFLFQKMAERYPGATIQFDCISKWLSEKTTKGDWKLTPNYTTPRMPFGVNKPNLQLLFDSWVPGIQIDEVEMPINKLDGMARWIIPLFLSIPYLKRMQPGFVLRVTFPTNSNVQ